MLPVNATDVADNLLRTFTPAEDAKITKWLDWIEALISLRVNPASLNQPLLGMVAVEVASAKWRNEAGAISQEVAVDDSRVVTRYRDSVTTDLAALLEPWWGTLIPSTADGGAFTIRPSYEPDRHAW